jgi:hypothetical protein
MALRSPLRFPVSAIVGVVVFAALAVIVPWRLKSGAANTPMSEIFFVFPAVEHVHPGAPVKILGVEAGRVEAVTLLQPPGVQAGQVRLTARVQSKLLAYVGRDSRARFARASPLGEPYVDVQLGAAESPRVEDGDTLFGDPAIGGRQLARDAAAVGAAARPFVRDVQKGSARVNNSAKALVADTLEWAPIGEQIRRVVGNARQSFSAARAALGGLPLAEWRAEGALAASALRAVRAKLTQVGAELTAEAEETSEQARFAVGLLRGLAKEVRAQLEGRVQGLAAQVRGARERFTTALRDRRYTVASFLQDEEIQNDIKGFQMTLKRKFWRFVLDGDGFGPAP